MPDPPSNQPAGPFVVHETQETKAGNFTVYKFPLSFGKYPLYWRRFGVDVPRECEAISCPVLFDFHGSYDSLYSQRSWTQWYQYQSKVPPKSKFVLVTLEGSPDAITYENLQLDREQSGSATSWNVEGWGTVTSIMDTADSCADEKEEPHCFEGATGQENSYPCYGTTQYKHPRICKPYTGKHRQEDKPAKQVHAGKCQGSSNANDWDYFHIVADFVVRTLHGDPRRLYFTGQSMGGQASMQFATAEGKYAMPPGLAPAAIVACSPGASRRSEVQIKGKVPALLLYGVRDSIAPPSAWSAFNRKQEYLFYDPSFQRILEEDGPVLKRALDMVGVQIKDEEDEKKGYALVMADCMTGGQLLAEPLESLAEKDLVGCKDRFGHRLSIDGSNRMVETVRTRLQRIVGAPVNMTRLKFNAPPEVPAAEAEAYMMRCANVDDTATGGAKHAEAKVCFFDGGHTFPWVDNEEKVDLFHDFVYKGFLRSGSLARQ